MNIYKLILTLKYYKFIYKQTIYIYIFEVMHTNIYNIFLDLRETSKSEKSSL